MAGRLAGDGRYQAGAHTAAIMNGRGYDFAIPYRQDLATVRVVAVWTDVIDVA